MTVAELIMRAKKEGLAFSIEGDKIKCRLPKAADLKIKALVDEIRRHRDAVIEALKQPTCFNCGAAMTPTTDIDGKPWLECRACAVGDGTDRPDGIAGIGASVINQIVEDGEVVAVLICSKILEAHIWLAFDDDFKPDSADLQAIFFANELPTLSTKSPEDLRAIHAERVKARMNAVEWQQIKDKHEADKKRLPQ